jgi:tetratricopeptide (TPR) repeat protein
LFFIVLPVAPVAWDYFYPSGYARWLLADAANQYDAGHVEKAQRLLARAYELSPEISGDPNFWQQLARIEFSPDSPVSENSFSATTVRKIADAEQRADAAAQIASFMLERKMYSNAIAILEEFLPSRKQRSPPQNNLIAYARSLANKDLELALEEVELALSKKKNDSFLDTRAWILHRMQRHEQALVDIDQSAELLSERFRANPVLEPVLAFMEGILADEKPSDTKPSDTEPSETEPKETEEKGTGWAYPQLIERFPWLTRANQDYLTLATVRYHRMKILEALGDRNRAQADARWLEAFAPKPWDSLD